MIRPMLRCGLGAVVTVLMIWSFATAQEAAPSVPPLFRPVAVWPPDSEVWTGSVAGPYGRPGDGRFHLKRVISLDPYSPFQKQKYLESVTVRIQRKKNGEFQGTISYHAGLRPFELRVSGRIDEKGRATFTESIDPQNAPQWHRWPWRFTGVMGPESWEGEVSGVPNFLVPLRTSPR